MKKKKKKIQSAEIYKIIVPKFNDNIRLVDFALHPGLVPHENREDVLLCQSVLLFFKFWNSRFGAQTMTPSIFTLNLSV